MAGATVPKQGAQASTGSYTRVSLLNSVAALMTERGTIDATLNEIAERSGVNSALIKYYFGNKDGLFLELLRYSIGKAIQDLEALVHMNLSPVEKMRIHLSGVVNVYFRHPYINRVMHLLLATNESVGKILSEELVQPLVAAQGTILEEGRSAGLFREIDPMLFYFHVIGACDHLFFGRYALKYAFEIDEINDEIRQRFITQLCEIVMVGISTLHQ